MDNHMPLWLPTAKDTEGTNISRAMSKLRIDSVEELHRWSVQAQRNSGVRLRALSVSDLIPNTNKFST